MSATARLIVMMEPKQKAEIEARAKRADVSAAEFARRQIFQSGDPEERAFFEALAALKPQVSHAAATIEHNLVAIRRMRESAEREDAQAGSVPQLAPEELRGIADRLQLHPAV
jgi:hypothetical protein